jgi:hypothetical protein
VSVLQITYTQTRQREADISENKSFNVPMNTYSLLKMFVCQYPDLSVDSCINQGIWVLKACPFLQRNRNPLPTVMGLNLKQFT